jgi:DNA polymerase
MVFGEGNQKANVMVISDPPNSDENMQGRPFMGEAGVVFNNMMKNVLNLERNDVYMTNVVKCRCIISGANNYRVEYYDVNEMKKCLPYLHQQIDVIKPRFILVMGEIAASVLFEKREGIDYFRSNQGALYKGIPVYVTYNPSELVGNIDLKRLAFVDLQGFNGKLGAGR